MVEFINTVGIEITLCVQTGYIYSYISLLLYDVMYFTIHKIGYFNWIFSSPPLPDFLTHWHVEPEFPLPRSSRLRVAPNE